MKVIQSTSIRPDFSWIGGIITVTCTITSISAPEKPLVTTYLIGSGSLVINMAPNFLQYPPCDYTLNELKIWEYSPSPAPVIQNKADPY